MDRYARIIERLESEDSYYPMSAAPYESLHRNIAWCIEARDWVGDDEGDETSKTCGLHERSGCQNGDEGLAWRELSGIKSKKTAE